MPNRFAAPALIAALRNDLGAATDAQLRQVVSMVDNLAVRGEVDALLAPLRPRLARIRPTRRLRFERLLFLPLDPVIVAPPDWTMGMLAVPRSALKPIAAQVRDALAPEAEMISALLGNGTMADTDTISSATAHIWPAGAQALTAAEIPPGWSAAGLSDTAYPPIASFVATALRHARHIETLASAVPDRENEAIAMAQTLSGAHADGPEAWRTVVLLLLLRARNKSAVLRAMTESARQRDATIRAATEQAVEAALDHFGRHLGTPNPDPAHAAERLDNLRSLLDAVAPGAGPNRLKAMDALRARAQTRCLERLKDGLQSEILAPLAASATDAPVDDTAMSAMERKARSLRRLEHVGRCLDDSVPFGEIMRNAAEELQNSIGPDVLSPVDKARLVELLVGPEAGLAALAAARKVA